MRTMTWTDNNGTATVLDGSTGILLLNNPVGLGAPNPANTIDDYIAFDGGVLVRRRYPVRAIALALLLEHATRVDTVIAELATILQGPGVLTWADDVHTRSLRNVIYEAGIDGSGDGDRYEWELVVSMLALDPWWYGPPASTALSTGATTPFDAAIIFNSFTPFDGGSAAAAVVTGDIEAYPVITVTGPATTLTLGSGGSSWSIASPLTGADTLVVDHRPASRGPSKNGAPVDWSLLTEASRLWPLATGTTSVITGATGTTAATAIVMAYEPRFRTP